MFDNGLVEYYRNKKLTTSNGFLKLDKFKIENTSVFPSYLSKVKRIFIDGKPYFTKIPYFSKETESEVLLGQAYNQAGLNSAIYTPAKIWDSSSRRAVDGVISNDVAQTENVVLAKDLVKGSFSSQGRFRFGSSQQKEKDLQNFFEEKAKRDFVLMHALDLASYNVDRNMGNFCFEFDGETVAGISVLDQGICMKALQDYPVYKDSFKNYIGDRQLTSRGKLISELKRNEVVQSVISSNEIAEVVGNISIPRIAEDIRDTIDYKVDSHVVNAFDKSFSTFAEEMAK